MKSISIICNKNGTCEKPNNDMLYFNNENDVTTLNLIFPEASTPVARWMLVDTISGSGDVFLGYGNNILFSLTYPYMVSGKLKIQPYTIGTTGATPTREYWQETVFNINSTLNGGTLPVVLPDVVAGIQSQINNLYTIKMDKLVSGIEDNFVSIDSTGNAKDSGLNNSDYVHIIGDETINGIKTFGSLPILNSSTPTLGNQATTKDYVDNTIEVISNGDVRTINNIASINHNFDIDSDSNNITINSKLGAIGIEVDGYTVEEADVLFLEKVDKEVGKELSSNDFTNTLKTKLDGIAAGAEVNVNANWNAVSGDAQILNKPFIPTSLADLTQDATHRTVTDTEKSIWNAKQDALGYTAENTLNKGNSNGYASLDINSKIPLNQIPDSILGQIHYKGTWDASSGIFPTPASLGDYYIVSVAGIISLIDYQIGDWIVYNGATWDKIDNTESVSLVNGQKGIVVLTTNDISDYLNKRYVTDSQKLLFANIDQDVKVSATPTFAGLTVDTNTIYVDKINHRVGIGTSTNLYAKLNIAGDSNIPTIGGGIMRFDTATGTNDVGVKIGCLAGSGDLGYSYIQGIHTGVGNDAIIALNPVGGLVGIGTYVPTAMLQINTKDATTKGIIIKGFTSQSAAALQVLDSAGSVMCSISGVNGSITPAYLTTNSIYGSVFENSGSGNNSRLTVSGNGALITRNVADANTILTIQNLNATSTGRLLELKNSSGTAVYAVDAYGAQLGEYFQNLSSGNNSKMQLGGNGTIINRNIADSNSALTINQIHASSTGNVIDCQVAGISKFYVTRTGIAVHGTTAIQDGGMYYASTSNAYVNVTNNGTIISRNTADANTALIVNQMNASSTGKILDLQAAGVSKSFFDINGQLGIQGIYYPASSIYSYIKPTSTGTVISRDVADTNTCLIVNQVNASSTGSIVDFQFGGVSKAYITNTGTLVGNLFYGYGMFNKSDSSNSRIDLNSTGTVISRNISDANPSLIINQIHASSTGAILSLQSEGVQKAYITKSGTLATPKVSNLTTENNGAIFINDTGLTISRNIADANTALIVNQIHASSTGSIIDAQFGGVSKFSVSTVGVVRIGSNLILSTNIQNTNGANYCTIAPSFNGAVISRNIADGNSALIVNQVNASSTGYIQEWQFGGVQLAQINVNGTFRTGDYANITNANNSYMQLGTNGTLIRRNIADSNPVLQVKNSHASSTGDIIQFINTSAIVGTYIKSTGALAIKNDLYVVGKDSGGTLELNMFKTNTSNQIETGSDLVLGTIEAEQDSGAITLFNMPVSAVTAGTEMSSTFKIGGANVLKVYAEADGAGSVQNTKVIATGAVIGTSTDNSTFEADGTLKFNGAATVYNDLMISVTNLRGGATPPTFAVFQNGVYANRFDDANTHIVYGSVEIQHDYKEGSDLEVHIHWSPSTTNTGNARFTYEYTVANMSTGTFGTTTTLTAVQAGSATVNKHQYLTIGTISGTGRKIGDVISFAFTRTGSDAADTFTGNAFVHQVGIHYECDTTGSRTQSGK